MHLEMTSRERVFAAFESRAYDYIPLISPVSLANVECMQQSRSFFPQANINPHRMAALAETSYTILHFDSINPCFGISSETSALGCPVDLGSTRRMANVLKPAFHSIDQIRIPADYFDSRPIRCILDAHRILKKKHGDKAALWGKILGPMSLLFYSFGIQNTFNTLILDPKALKQILGEFGEICIRFALEQLEAGADFITISEDAAGALISRECYREFLMDIESKVCEEIRRYSYVVFHLSCKILDKVDLFADSGFDALSFDSRNDIREIRRLSGKMKLIGCVNSPITLLNGDKKDVAREVEYSIRNGVSFVAPECSVHISVSNANLLAMRDAVLMYTHKHHVP